MKNKRGLELAINTAVILILAIILLVFLVLFFTGASENFLVKIKSYFSYSNVDEIIETCNFFADTNSMYSFCCEKRNVKYYNNEKKAEGLFSCIEIADKFDTKKLNCEEASC